MARLIRWSGDRIMSLALLIIASVFLIWLSAMKICGIILETEYQTTCRINLDRSYLPSHNTRRNGERERARDSDTQ